MILTKTIQQKKDPNKYNIYVDDEYVFALLLSDMEYFNLSLGGEVSAETLNDINEKLIYSRAQDCALNFLGYKLRTKKEIRQRLFKENYSEIMVEEVISFLEKYNYINDGEYAKKYIEDRLRLSPRGRFALKMELLQRGVCGDDIENALADTEIDEFEDAYNLIYRKARGNFDIIDEDKKRKLYAFLQRRGYSYDIIKDVFLRIKEETTQ